MSPITDKWCDIMQGYLSTSTIVFVNRLGLRYNVGLN